MSDRMGLTDPEVKWLQDNQTGEGRSLVRQYQMITSCPSDPGARAIFEVMRDEWRQSPAYPCKAEASR